MWIFGYGSLVWKVDFPYVKKVVGYIKGYDRRFWQGSIDHRGVPGKPGRVVTLVPSSDPEARVWGVAYEIHDDDKETIQTIDRRESRFTKVVIPFYPTSSSCSESVDFDAQIGVLDTTVYVGNPSGPLFLGNADVSTIARQIVDSEGPSGPNDEYLFKLAAFMKTHFPNVVDEHLFEIEKASQVWGAAYKIHDRDVSRVMKHLDMREVMGYEKVPIGFHPIPNHTQNILEPPSPLDYNNHPSLILDPSRPGLYGDESNQSESVHSLLIELVPSANPFDENEGINGSRAASCRIPNIPNKVEEPAPVTQVPDIPVPEDNNHDEDISRGNPFTVIMYYGSPENDHYLGPAPLQVMARQIFESIGPSGKNKEYLYNLCSAMKQISNEAMDDHLIELEEAVREMDVQFNIETPETPIEL